MELIKRAVLFILFGVAFVSCEPDPDPEFVYPKAYLPAYPESFWDYTNGERVVTSSSYVSHRFQASIASIKNTSPVYVPMYNGEYLYEYSITQNSTEYPIMKLLDEKVGASWVIREINDEPIMRKVVAAPDSIIIPYPPYTDTIDLVFKDLKVVIEYIDSLGEKRWHQKEYYAKNVGLIRVEVDNPQDTLGAIILKDIQEYSINK